MIVKLLYCKTRVIQMKPEIKELMEGKLKEMNHDEELVKEYTIWKDENERINASIINEERKEAHEEGIEEGIEIGIRKGIKEGTFNAKKEIVLEMYNNNIALDIISECTKLTKEEINKILNNRN